jgi:hypothetical protein
LAYPDDTELYNVLFQPRGNQPQFGSVNHSGGRQNYPNHQDLSRYERTNVPRNISNAPAWMTNASSVTNTTEGDTTLENDGKPKKPKLFVVSASCFASSAKVCRPMPLEMDNGLPAVQFRFGHTDDDEINFSCHVDSCAAMNVGNLRVHQWIITNYPAVVEEYIQFDDENPFDPIQLECAVDDANLMSDTNVGKLTALVRYKTQYKDELGTQLTLSFGLGSAVAVNAIIGIPTLKTWGCSICFISNVLQCTHIRKRLPLSYGVANMGLPSSVHFSTETDFQRPRQQTNVGRAFVISLDDDAAAMTDSSRHDQKTSDEKLVVADCMEQGYLQRSVNKSE